MAEISNKQTFSISNNCVFNFIDIPKETWSCINDLSKTGMIDSQKANQELTLILDDCIKIEGLLNSAKNKNEDPINISNILQSKYLKAFLLKLEPCLSTLQTQALNTKELMN